MSETIPKVILAGFGLWFVAGFLLTILQLRFLVFLGSWVCSLWGCTYGFGADCPNCGKQLEGTISTKSSWETIERKRHERQHEK